MPLCSDEKQRGINRDWKDRSGQIGDPYRQSVLNCTWKRCSDQICMMKDAGVLHIVRCADDQSMFVRSSCLSIGSFGMESADRLRASAFQ